MRTDRAGAGPARGTRIRGPARRRSSSLLGAIVYDPSGKTYAFTQPVAADATSRCRSTVDHISGDSAYLSRGPQAGTQVVTVGAEELYGVQTGVLAQT